MNIITDNRFVFHAVLRNDLYSFARKSFSLIYPGAEFIDSWYIRSMCYELERVAYGETTRLLITIPPRHLKSLTTSVALPAWMLVRDPTTKILVTSYGEDLVREHARQFRTVVHAPFYRDLNPESQIAPGRDTQLETGTKKGGLRRAVSIGGAITGFGADVLIIDDPLKADDAHSVGQRELVQRYYAETLLSRLDDKRYGRIIVIQQRLHEDDLAGYLLEAGGFRHLNLPAIAEEDTGHLIGPNGEIYQRRKGDVLCPQREPISTLDRIRREMGSVAFSAQYQQNPVPPKGAIVRLEQFGIYRTPITKTEYSRIIQSWDTADTAEPKSDYSVCTTWGLLGDQWHLLDVYRDRLDYPALKAKVMQHRIDWTADTILIERTGVGQALVRELLDLQREAHSDSRAPSTWQTIGIKPRENKETRLRVAMDTIAQGKVHLPDEAPWLHDLKRELRAFPNGRYDDQVDSVSQFIMWTKNPRALRRPGERPPGRPTGLSQPN